VPLTPGRVLCPRCDVRFYRDSRCLPLAVTAVVEAESGSVLNFRVSGVGFTALTFRVICALNPLNLC
jgi:hypothetical protein